MDSKHDRGWDERDWPFPLLLPWALVAATVVLINVIAAIMKGC